MGALVGGGGAAVAAFNAATAAAAAQAAAIAAVGSPNQQHLLLPPGEVIRNSGKFPKPTKIPGKTYCKDEVVIRNADSGKGKYISLMNKKKQATYPLFLISYLPPACLCTLPSVPISYGH